jgi:hypothetical protein
MKIKMKIIEDCLRWWIIGLQRMLKLVCIRQQTACRFLDHAAFLRGL